MKHSFALTCISTLCLILYLAGCSKDKRIVNPPTANDSVEVVFQDGEEPSPLYRGTRDAVIRDGFGMRNMNAGTAAEDTLGYVELAGVLYERRLLVRFDLSGLTDCTFVLEAELTLHLSTGQPGNPVLAIFEAAVPQVLPGTWSEGTGYTDDGISWLYADGVVPWENPGGDLVDIVLDEATAGSDSTVTFSLPAGLVLRWIRSPVTNHGLLVSAWPSSSEAFRLVRMRESSDPQKRPRLYIKYWKGG